MESAGWLVSAGIALFWLGILIGYERGVQVGSKRIIDTVKAFSAGVKAATSDTTEEEGV